MMMMMMMIRHSDTNCDVERYCDHDRGCPPPNEDGVGAYMGWE